MGLTAELESGASFPTIASLAMRKILNTACCW